MQCCRVSAYEYELDYVTGRSRAVTKQRQRGLVNIHELSPSHSSAGLAAGVAGLERTVEQCGFHQRGMRVCVLGVAVGGRQEV